MEPPAHAKLLALAAQNTLRPAGLFQKGKSRTWLDDNGWWVGIVEFQPSSWSPGSYLNCACMWLWDVKKRLSFDEGGRVAPFTEFRNERQFEVVARALAEQALAEIILYRQRFRNVHQLSQHFLQVRPTGLWRNFHAGVAAALDGETEHARRFFKLAIDSESDDGREWVADAKKDARELSVIAGDAVHFRQVISERIQDSRVMQKLPKRASIEFDH